MKKKKKKEIIPTCEFCVYWLSAKFQGDGNKLCKESGNIVKSNFDSCEYFEKANFFYCKKENQRVNLVACKARYSNGHGCKGCFQGEIAKHLVEKEK